MPETVNPYMEGQKAWGQWADARFNGAAYPENPYEWDTRAYWDRELGFDDAEAAYWV